jgi:hypothetical protein
MPAGAAKGYQLAVSLIRPSQISKANVALYTFQPSLTPRIGSVSPAQLSPYSTNATVTMSLSLPMSAGGVTTEHLGNATVSLLAGNWSVPARQVRLPPSGVQGARRSVSYRESWT